MLAGSNMESYFEIMSAMDSIQNMSNENLQKILDILRIKYKTNVDMKFVTQTLPSLMIKMKIFTITVKFLDKAILSEINALIDNVMPLFDDYFTERNFAKKQQNAYLTFCKTFTTS